jgi:hypothetical protein
LVTPYVLLIAYYISTYFPGDPLFYLLPMGLLTLFPCSLAALLLRHFWKINYEDGSTKGDLLTLVFGSMSFMGIIVGLFGYMYYFMDISR